MDAGVRIGGVIVNVDIEALVDVVLDDHKVAIIHRHVVVELCRADVARHIRDILSRQCERTPRQVWEAVRHHRVLDIELHRAIVKVVTPLVPVIVFCRSLGGICGEPLPFQGMPGEVQHVQVSAVAAHKHPSCHAGTSKPLLSCKHWDSLQSCQMTVHRCNCA